MNKRKNFFKCALTNFIVFLSCFFMFLYEKVKTAQYSDFPQYISVSFLVFLIVMVLYLPSYGAVCYYSFRKTLYPNVILFCFLVIFFSLLYFYFDIFSLQKTVADFVKICVLLPLIASGISFAFSLVVKFLIYLKEKNI